MKRTGLLEQDEGVCEYDMSFGSPSECFMWAISSTLIACMLPHFPSRTMVETTFTQDVQLIDHSSSLSSLAGSLQQYSQNITCVQHEMELFKSLILTRDVFTNWRFRPDIVPSGQSETLWLFSFFLPRSCRQVMF